MVVTRSLPRIQIHVVNTILYPRQPLPLLPRNASLLQLLQAMRGESGVVECAFVESSVTEAAYFSTPLELGVSCERKRLLAECCQRC